MFEQIQHGAFVRSDGARLQGVSSEQNAVHRSSREIKNYHREYRQDGMVGINMLELPLGNRGFDQPGELPVAGPKIFSGKPLRLIRRLHHYLLHQKRVIRIRHAEIEIAVDERGDRLAQRRVIRSFGLDEPAGLRG